jgi:hypothetical protein
LRDRCRDNALVHVIEGLLATFRRKISGSGQHQQG